MIAKELMDKKRELERKIANLLQSFTADTGFVCDSYARPVYTSDGTIKRYDVEIQVKVYCET